MHVTEITDEMKRTVAAYHQAFAGSRGYVTGVYTMSSWDASNEPRVYVRYSSGVVVVEEYVERILATFNAPARYVIGNDLQVPHTCMFCGTPYPTEEECTAHEDTCG